MSLGDLSAKYTRGPAGGSASAVNLAELGIKEEPSRDSEASSGSPKASPKATMARRPSVVAALAAGGTWDTIDPEFEAFQRGWAGEAGEGPVERAADRTELEKMQTKMQTKTKSRQDRYMQAGWSRPERESQSPRDGMGAVRQGAPAAKTRQGGAAARVHWPLFAGPADINERQSPR
jgi:hypothetical protein